MRAKYAENYAIYFSTAFKDNVMPQLLAYQMACHLLSVLSRNNNTVMMNMGGNIFISYSIFELQIFVPTECTLKSAKVMLIEYYNLSVKSCTNTGTVVVLVIIKFSLITPPPTHPTKPFTP